MRNLTQTAKCKKQMHYDVYFYSHLCQLCKYFTCSKHIKEQIRDLKRKMKNPSKNQDQEVSKRRNISDSEEDNEILKDFHEQQKKYADIKTARRGKGICPVIKK